MIELSDALTAAISSGENVIAAVRDATGYTIEQLSIISGLAEPEIVEMEAGNTTHLARLLSSLGIGAST